MARKKKKRKVNTRKSYSKREFTHIVCSQCKICGKPVDPSFCYSGLYKTDGPAFMSKVFPSLLGLSKKYSEEGMSIRRLPQREFTSCFCFKICGEEKKTQENCDFLEYCYAEFLDQLEKNFESRKQVRRDRRAQLEIPYATTFCSSNKEFSEIIERILNGDYHTEQDQDQRLP